MITRVWYPNDVQAKISFEVMESVVLKCTNATPEQVEQDRQALYEYLVRNPDILQVAVVDQPPETAQESAVERKTFTQYFVLKDIISKEPYMGLRGMGVYIVPNTPTTFRN